MSKYTFTIGNWTGESLVDYDSSATPWTVSVPKAAWSSDYAVTDITPTSVKMQNSASSDMVVPEFVEFGRQPVANVYNGTSVPQNMQHSVKSGIRTLNKDVLLFKVTNSVSGQEVIFPITVNVTAVVPTMPLLTEAVVNWAVTRGLTTLFKDSNVPANIARQVKGDLRVDI